MILLLWESGNEHFIAARGRHWRRRDRHSLRLLPVAIGLASHSDREEHHRLGKLARQLRAGVSQPYPATGRAGDGRPGAGVARAQKLAVFDQVSNGPGLVVVALS